MQNLFLRKLKWAAMAMTPHSAWNPWQKASLARPRLTSGVLAQGGEVAEHSHLCERPALVHCSCVILLHSAPPEWGACK